jgi:hypothetical protein
MLSLSPEERLDVLQGFVDSVAELSLVGELEVGRPVVEETLAGGRSDTA